MKDLTFVLANAQQVTRSVGFAIIQFEKYLTIDEVVFSEPGEMLILGAHTLEGLNLRIEPRTKKLELAGPILAATPTRAHLASPLHRATQRPRREVRT